MLPFDHGDLARRVEPLGQRAREPGRHVLNGDDRDGERCGEARQNLREGDGTAGRGSDRDAGERAARPHGGAPQRLARRDGRGRGRRRGACRLHRAQVRTPAAEVPDLLDELALHVHDIDQ